MGKINSKNLIWGSIGLLTVLILIVFYVLRPDTTPEIEEIPLEVNMPADTLLEFGIPISEYDMEEGRVGRGEFFSNLMSKLGVGQKTIYDLSVKSSGVFDLKQIRVGNHYHAYYTKGDSASLAYLVYERDNKSFVVFGLKDSLSVVIHEKNIETTVHYSEVTINNSLWMDVKAAGVTPLLALKLSEVYAWTIDFFGLQKGDSFKATYEVKSYKGEILDVECIRYAVFTHGGKEYPVYYYEEEEGGNVYWNENGESMRKAFLKAPLNFTRISSGFSYARRHPISRVVRPHTGIDYAAPMGTPVMSIGDGVVIQKGYKGGGGHTVKIKHNSVYSSAYLHLSKYGKGIAVGTRVSQGQIIGYVGSTGSSTGPHLDFRIWKNNSPINPLKMESPPALPVRKENMDKFIAARNEDRNLITNIFAQEAFDRMLHIVSGSSDSLL